MECRIRVACQLITHGSKPLLWLAEQNLGYMDITEDDTASYVERRALYNGPPTMCLRRWGFWLDRLEKLGKEASGLSEEIRTSVLEAAQTMRTIERTIGHTLLK